MYRGGAAPLSAAAPGAADGGGAAFTVAAGLSGMAAMRRREGVSLAADPPAGSASLRTDITLPLAHAPSAIPIWTSQPSSLEKKSPAACGSWKVYLQHTRCSGLSGARSTE